MAILEAKVSPPAKIDEFHGRRRSARDRMIRHGDGLAERAAEAEHRRREMTPARPNGSTAVRIISHRVAPSARAASLCVAASARRPRGRSR